MSKKKFSSVNNQVDFIQLEHKILDKWETEKTFPRLVEKNRGKKKWSFLDGPITANNPMGVHHAWGRTLKDIFQRYHAMNGFDMRYQNGFDCQGLWVEVEVEKELDFKSKKDVEKFGIEKFITLCKERVHKYSAIQTEQSKRLGYWMDWDNSYFTMSDENNYTIWAFLKKLFERGKIRTGLDVVPWSGRSGTSYSQMEIIEGRKLVAHKAVFVKFPLVNRENEYLLVWTTTPWTLTSNVSAAVNVNLEYVKLRASDGSLYYFADDNLDYPRLERQFKEKKQWVQGVPKLKTISQIFKEHGGFTKEGTLKGAKMVGWQYTGPFDDLPAQSIPGGYPFPNDELQDIGVTAISCHKVIDGGKDAIGNDIVVSGEGTGIVHIAPGCGDIDNKLGKKLGLVNIAPLDEESHYLSEMGWLEGLLATDETTTDKILQNLKENNFLVHIEKYPHVYPHCWRSGDELVFRMVTEWYINMDWRDEIKNNVKDIKWIPDYGSDREMEWLTNMGDWMISKKRFWGLALPIWVFEDGSFYVVGSRQELKSLAVEGWDNFKDKSPHRPFIDQVKIKHPDSGLIGTRIPDVGNPWLDAGIVPYSTLQYSDNKEYWNEWFPADLVLECFPGQFRNWFYSLLAMSTIMENKAPFKTLLGHALVKAEDGREMHKSWGNAIWFEDAAEKMGVDVMRWMYTAHNPEQNLNFGYKVADETRKQLITLWNSYSFFVTYANLDGYSPGDSLQNQKSMTPLDNWILAKVNELVKNATECYENYQVFKIMKMSNEFLDDLSNWYIRRNRRRFWKSDNDSDKSAAYDTLYHTLIKFIKILAPVIPFVSEEIYCNLMSSFSGGNSRSIHLSEFPAYDNALANDELISEIDSVKQIVSLGRSVRNKANIKIRQPLSELVIKSEKQIITYLSRNEDQLKEEINVKSIRYIEDDSEVIHYQVKPNFQMLGQKYGAQMKKIAGLLSSMDVDILLNGIKSGEGVHIDLSGNQIKIVPNELIIEENPVKGFSATSNYNSTVALNINLDTELINEGIVRDIVRQIQNLRKESGLRVEDRISVAIESGELVNRAVESFGDYLLNEVLGTELTKDIESAQYKISFKINGEPVDIGISVVRMGE